MSSKAAIKFFYPVFLFRFQAQDPVTNKIKPADFSPAVCKLADQAAWTYQKMRGEKERPYFLALPCDKCQDSSTIPQNHQYPLQ